MNRRAFLAGAAAAAAVASRLSGQTYEWGGPVIDIHLHFRPNDANIQHLEGSGVPKADLRIIAEGSFLQPNVLALLVRGGSSVTSINQLKNKVISVNAPNGSHRGEAATRTRQPILPGAPGP